MNSIASIQSLKSIKVFCNDFFHYSVEPLIETLVANYIQLKELTLAKTTLSTSSIYSLTKLKTIEKLIFVDIVIVDDINCLLLAVAQLPLLRVFHLHIETAVPAKGITSLLKMVLELSDLYIGISVFDFDIDSYNDMLNTVKKRQNDVKLKITLDSPENQVKVPSEIISSNRQWIDISPADISTDLLIKYHDL